MHNQLGLISAHFFSNQPLYNKSNGTEFSSQSTDPKKEASHVTHITKFFENNKDQFNSLHVENMNRVATHAEIKAKEIRTNTQGILKFFIFVLSLQWSIRKARLEEASNYELLARTIRQASTLAATKNPLTTTITPYQIIQQLQQPQFTPLQPQFFQPYLPQPTHHQQIIIVQPQPNNQNSADELSQFQQANTHLQQQLHNMIYQQQQMQQTINEQQQENQRLSQSAQQVRQREQFKEQENINLQHQLSTLNTEKQQLQQRIQLLQNNPQNTGGTNPSGPNSGTVPTPPGGNGTVPTPPGGNGGGTGPTPPGSNGTAPTPPGGNGTVPPTPPGGNGGGPIGPPTGPGGFPPKKEKPIINGTPKEINLAREKNSDVVAKYVENFKKVYEPIKVSKGQMEDFTKNTQLNDAIAKGLNKLRDLNGLTQIEEDGNSYQTVGKGRVPAPRDINLQTVSETWNKRKQKPFDINKDQSLSLALVLNLMEYLENFKEIEKEISEFNKIANGFILDRKNLSDNILNLLTSHLPNVRNDFNLIDEGYNTLNKTNAKLYQEVKSFKEFLQKENTSKQKNDLEFNKLMSQLQNSTSNLIDEFESFQTFVDDFRKSYKNCYVAIEPEFEKIKSKFEEAENKLKAMLSKRVSMSSKRGSLLSGTVVDETSDDKVTSKIQEYASAYSQPQDSAAVKIWQGKLSKANNFF